MKKFRSLTSFVAAALALCLVALPGCGKSPEDVIRGGIVAELDAVKSGVPDELVESMEATAAESIDALGLDSEKYAKAYLEGFAYEIGDIEVDKDKGTAVAHVTITIKSMQDIVHGFQDEFEAALAGLDSFPSEDELMKMGGEAMMSATEAAEPKSTDVEFDYKLDGEKWVPDESSVLGELAAALV